MTAPAASPLTPEEIAAVRKPYRAASLLPGRAYHDPGIHDFERQQWLRRDWIVVGREEDAPSTGTYFTVDHARIYTLPEEPAPIYIAAAGNKAAEMAGQLGDGLISTSPDKDVVEAFTSAGGGEKPKYGQVTVCWAADEKQALQTAKEWWASSAVPGELSQELPLPRHFEQATTLVRDEDIEKSIVCGPDPARHRKAIQEFVDAGIEQVYVHQVVPDQQAFFDFYRRHILPSFAKR